MKTILQRSRNLSENPVALHDVETGHLAGAREYKKSLSFLYTSHLLGKMTETKVLVKLKGVPASVLSKLVAKGYYSTKSEALRAGIVGLGKEFGIISPTEEAWLNLQSEIRKAKKTPVTREVFRELQRVETES